MTEEIDSWLTDELICPHCGATNYDELEESEGKTTCQECEKDFEFERDYTVRYTSRKIEKQI